MKLHLSRTLLPVLLTLAPAASAQANARDAGSVPPPQPTLEMPEATLPGILSGFSSVLSASLLPGWGGPQSLSTGQIAGVVYLDNNCNKIFDAGDQPLPFHRVRIRLKGTLLVRYRYTDSNGFYDSGPLPAPANYVISSGYYNLGVRSGGRTVKRALPLLGVLADVPIPTCSAQTGYSWFKSY